MPLLTYEPLTDLPEPMLILAWRFADESGPAFACATTTEERPLPGLPVVMEQERTLSRVAERA